MPFADPAARYLLSPRALADLDDIWRYGAEAWPPEQADRYVDDLVRVFETLAAMPMLARERTEFTPPVRIHVHGAHLIIYTLAPDQIVILRLLGGRRDWRSVLDALD